jgi:very-short-patch-repair endonuclease
MRSRSPSSASSTSGRPSSRPNTAAGRIDGAWPLCLCMARKGATPDREVAAIAARQHGAVKTRQLRKAGLVSASIASRVANERLHKVHQGVYAVGHSGLPRQGRWMAAVLACDEESRKAFLSHRSAAELWGLLSPSHGLVDVTVPGDGGRKRRVGIRVHRSRTLRPADTTRRDGIPVTSPTRTIHDLRRTRPARGGANAEQLRRAIRQASIFGLPFDDPATERTRSDLELLFVEICRRHRLPAPDVNVEIGDIEVDFLWRRRRLVVETDSYRYHRGPAAFQRDRDRDLDLQALGFQVVRFSEQHLEDEPDRVAQTVRRLLSRST